MARFNRLYVDVGPIGTNRHVSAPVLSASHLLMVCRIIHLVFVNGGGRLVSGFPVAEFVPHVPDRRFGVCKYASATEMEESAVYQVGRGR